MNRKRKKKPLAPNLVGIFDDLIDETVEIKSEIPEPRDVDRALVMFWKQEKCLRCHTVYEGSCYHADPMLMVERQAPIVHFGRHFGWKYVGIVFLPVPDFACYDALPRKIEYVRTKVRVCPKCIHRPNVIYLPGAAA
jgi:hypothetical protein